MIINRVKEVCDIRDRAEALSERNWAMLEV
jgi:hypothetical protein